MLVGVTWRRVLEKVYNMVKKYYWSMLLILNYADLETSDGRKQKQNRRLVSMPASLRTSGK